jgi:hypothetical protein
MNQLTMEQPVVKKPRKPRTKKADMIKKKAEQEKLKETQVPKKRGRKPKGGKIIKTEINIHEPVMEQKVVILHLKCKNDDLNEHFITDITQYNPHIVGEIQPYDNENVSSYCIIPGEEAHSHVEMKQDQCDKSDIKSKEYVLMKKNINEKLKELEHKFNTNQVNTNSACFWCTCAFNSNTIHIPSLYFQEKYDVYGCFCSPECACSYLFKQNIDNNTKYERYQLLNYLYGKVYEYKKEIKPAPDPHYTLDKYYGNLTIQEYRQLLEYDRLILVIDKPLTKIYPELHEDNNDFETIYENKIHLKKSTKVNKSQVLKKVFQHTSSV